jgi:hypothetical protein
LPVLNPFLFKIGSFVSCHYFWFQKWQQATSPLVGFEGNEDLVAFGNGKWESKR